MVQIGDLTSVIIIIIIKLKNNVFIKIKTCQNDVFFCVCVFLCFFFVLFFVVLFFFFGGGGYNEIQYSKLPGHWCKLYA